MSAVDLLAAEIQGARLPEAVMEYAFWPGRRFRFDLAFCEDKLAVEVEGGAWIRGRHTRGAGYERDCLKYNQAALMGWTVLRFTTGMVVDGKAMETIRAWFEARRKG